MFEVSIHTSFASAHRLRGYEGVCENIHGHNWKAEVVLRTEKLNEIGIGIDFKTLKSMTDEILFQLDHQDINQIKPFDQINPSSENLAKWLYDELSAKLNDGSLCIHRVNVQETDFYTASYFEGE